MTLIQLVRTNFADAVVFVVGTVAINVVGEIIVVVVGLFSLVPKSLNLKSLILDFVILYWNISS